MISKIRIRIRKFLVILAIFFFTATASGEIMEFENLSVNIPANWHAFQNDSTVEIIADNHSASIRITISELGEDSLETIAQNFSQSHQGTQPELDEDGDYTFTFENSSVIFTADDEKYCMFVITSDPEYESQSDSDSDDVGAILDSLVLKKPEFELEAESESESESDSEANSE